jgi:hypothetical protein
MSPSLFAAGRQGTAFAVLYGGARGPHSDDRHMVRAVPWRYSKSVSTQ